MINFVSFVAQSFLYFKIKPPIKFEICMLLEYSLFKTVVIKFSIKEYVVP